MNRGRLFRYAFVKSIPVMMGYVFLGLAFGILLNSELGLSWVWALYMSAVIYAGSMEFALIPLLGAVTPLPTVAIMTLLVNSRHLFYGLSFVEPYREMGRLRPYMIYSLTDETYSVLCSCAGDPEVNADRHIVYFWISLMHHIYWTVGSVLGTILGASISLDTTGIDFAMTALFVVILVDQIRGGGRDAWQCAAVGLCVGLVFLIALGADRFLLPTLAVTVFALLLMELLNAGKEARA
ncbi:MAG: AzlC family ABC transporter permease [Clostridia bacterium]|nr:AzlC family ABC transporter permease [Clostridia bacterium]